MLYSTDVATVKGITCVADGSLLADGEFVVWVRQYNLTSLRDALIKSAATTAKFSTTDKKSYVAHLPSISNAAGGTTRQT